MMSLNLVAVNLGRAGGPQGEPMHIASAIEYETIARPEGLPEDFAPDDGVSLRFLALKALDGARLEAALWQPLGKTPADTTMIVMVHGSGDSYRLGPPFSLARGLSPRGYAALAINTRQHDGSINTDNFFDIRRDIEAAVMTARALGYRRIALHGHSLGNIQVLYYAATDWSPDIRAVVLTGCFANLPSRSRTILIQNEERYHALAGAALASLRDGTPEQPLPHKMRYIEGQDVPVTGQHFLTYRLEQSSVADGTYWIRRVPRPILIVVNESDGIVQPFEPHMLLAAANAQYSLPPNVKFVRLPDARAPSVDGHMFVGNEKRLDDAVAAWLADQQL